MSIFFFKSQLLKHYWNIIQCTFCSCISSLVSIQCVYSKVTFFQLFNTILFVLCVAANCCLLVDLCSQCITFGESRQLQNSQWKITTKSESKQSVTQMMIMMIDGSKKRGRDLYYFSCFCSIVFDDHRMLLRPIRLMMAHQEV